MEKSEFRDDRAADERCLCGNLVARVTPGGVEILCRRCRHIHRIPWEREAVARQTRGSPAATSR